MKVVLLTTKTPHHFYYARELSRRFPLEAVFLETKQAKAPFETEHPFERERDEYEQKALLGSAPVSFDGIAPAVESASMNDPASIARLAAIMPDVILVFGTGKLQPPVFRAARRACLNLHGGNPEQYRGLDNHLWTIYHNDFKNLVTTLHSVDERLDTGDIVLQEHIPVGRGAKLHELRARNTEVCVRMSLQALATLSEGGRLPARPQLQRGRYYSFMPSCIKQQCLEHFERHVGRL